MKPYLTVLGDGAAEVLVERSRFIGHVCHAVDVSGCDGFFDGVRREHRQATHNVPAYVLGEGCRFVWAGDDGEPRGTSGAPIAHMLVAEGISDVAVMVTRYFGGVKLGTGGLVRAYTGAAKLALSAAGLGWVRERLVFAAELDYAGHSRLCASELFRVENVGFGALVTLEASCEPCDREGVAALLRAAAGGGEFRVLWERVGVVVEPV